MKRDPFYVDSTFFDVFSYHFVEGNKKCIDETLYGCSFKSGQLTNYSAKWIQSEKQLPLIICMEKPITQVTA